MWAQPTRSSSQPQLLSGKGNQLPALIGMGLALLSLLCAVIAALRGANLFLSVLIGLLVIRLFALCYSFLQASSNSNQSSRPSMQQQQSFMPDMSAGSTAFAAPDFTMNAAPWSYPQNEPFAPSNAPFNAPTNTPFNSAFSAPTNAPYVPFNSAFSAPTNTPSQLAEYNGDSPTIPAIPIEQDELFQLDAPAMGEYVLYVPQEGEALVDCQDRFAINTHRGRYAIADGVSGSFVPSAWARILARGFVDYDQDAYQTIPMMTQGQDTAGGSLYFGERTQFEQWLQQCRTSWHTWIRNRWIPAINASRMQYGESPLNWESEIERGAQTTLTGCWLRSRNNPTDPYIDVHVSVIGDSEFFLFRRDEQGAWQNVAALPFISIDEFDKRPAVLTTHTETDQTGYAWTQWQEGSIAALPDDRIVLATAPLAQWILMQVQQQQTQWTTLLESTNSAFHEQMLRSEQHANRLGNSDVTMLVIPIPAPNMNR